MNFEDIPTNLLYLEQTAEQAFMQRNYSEAAELYEQVALIDPDTKQYCWYLGLALLLQGQETEAQTVWLLTLAEGSEEQTEQWTRELITVLQSQSNQQEASGNLKNAWLVRQYIREFDPQDLENLLALILLSQQIDTFDQDDPFLAAALNLIQAEVGYEKYNEKLLKILKNLLEAYPDHSLILEVFQLLAIKIEEPQTLLELIFNKAHTVIEHLNQQQADQLTELCLQLSPNPLEAFINLSNLYQKANRNLESLKFTERVFQLPHALIDEVAAYYTMTKAWMGAGGQWQQARLSYQKYQNAISQLIQSDVANIDEFHLPKLLTSTAFFPYLEDNPKDAHEFRLRVAQFCQVGIQKQSDFKGLSQPSKPSLDVSGLIRKPKIGYLSSCLRRHSVGWIIRWLLKHHNYQDFEINAYSLTQTRDHIQESISQNVSQFYDFSTAETITEVAERIYDDEIDILIELDSLTSSEACGVAALKPAPIQISWLGFDAPDLPNIDYFIADPYVLPESAQEYYVSKIYRLPSTYVAVDGFEVDVPTLRRDQLGIPNDAVIYLTCQTASKRHPHTGRLQLQVIKEMPNSYFLIKGQADQESIRTFFLQIAEEEGVSSDRLIFLPDVASEATHRANLGIADVVLDTYPYNGATTTLETLWMGIPMVTRVGEQFAARNSYTMMINAGITEGIAWTDEEYIDWGVRLGADTALRQQISWKLKQSRQTAPLWNTKQFARDLENAYEQMWTRYLEK